MCRYNTAIARPSHHRDNKITPSTWWIKTSACLLDSKFTFSFKYEISGMNLKMVVFLLSAHNSLTVENKAIHWLSLEIPEQLPTQRNCYRKTCTSILLSARSGSQYRLPQHLTLPKKSIKDSWRRHGVLWNQLPLWGTNKVLLDLSYDTESPATGHLYVSDRTSNKHQGWAVCAGSPGELTRAGSTWDGKPIGSGNSRRRNCTQLGWEGGSVQPTITKTSAWGEDLLIHYLK